MAWQHAGIGPMQGQANHFYRFTSEKSLYPVHRFVSELERLYGVLDAHLSGRDYMVGPGKGSYSIADICSFTFVNSCCFAGVDLSRFPNLVRWHQQILQRPAVQRGLKVPFETFYQNGGYQQKMVDDQDWIRQEESLKQFLTKAKEHYS